MYLEEQGEAAADGPHFVVGRDQQARWIVIETHGLCGGLFRNRAAALRYAAEECQAYQADFEISRAPICLKFR
jgi:hypothetical protein